MEGRKCYVLMSYLKHQKEQAQNQSSQIWSL